MFEGVEGHDDEGLRHMPRPTAPQIRRARNGDALTQIPLCCSFSPFGQGGSDVRIAATVMWQGG